MVMCMLELSIQFQWIHIKAQSIMGIWYLKDRANEGDHLKNIIYFHNKELELFSIKLTTREHRQRDLIISKLVICLEMRAGSM